MAREKFNSSVAQEIKARYFNATKSQLAPFDVRLVMFANWKTDKSNQNVICGSSMQLEIEVGAGI
jgi:hypothetical protein